MCPDILIWTNFVHSLSSPWSTPGSLHEFWTKSESCSKMGDDMKARLTSASQKKVENHPILFDQPQSFRAAPPYWLFETLHGIGMFRTTLAIRADNLYLTGFTNGRGQYFSFKADQYNSYIIPGSIELSFTAHYADLVGDGEGGAAWMKLVDLDLSRPAVQDAIKVVCSYHQDRKSAEQIKELKKALATLVVFVCESARFPYIRQRVESAFNTDLDDPETEENRYLGHRGAQLVVQWKRISCAILIWKKENSWNSQEAKELAVERPEGPGIATVEEALASVWPILSARGCSVKYTL